MGGRGEDFHCRKRVRPKRRVGGKVFSCFIKMMGGTEWRFRGLLDGQRHTREFNVILSLFKFLLSG